MDRATTFWESYDDRKTLIKDLPVRHLVNILNWIKKSNEETAGTAYSPEICYILEAEAEIRVLKGFAANEAIPKKLKGGTYIVINQSLADKAIEYCKTLFHKVKIQVAIAKKG